MKLNPNNRWVKKADMIPWDEIEKRYTKLFTNSKGNVEKPLRLALGACIIQAEYGYSDEETALQIQENAYLQYFCGYSEYNDEKQPFDPSLMVYFRKRPTLEILGEINELIIKNAQSDDNGYDDEPPANNGTLHTIALAIVVLNLRKVHCAFFNFCTFYYPFCPILKKQRLFSKH